jgi:hypothetical protein
VTAFAVVVAALPTGVVAALPTGVVAALTAGLPTASFDFSSGFLLTGTINFGLAAGAAWRFTGRIRAPNMVLRVIE